MEGWLRKKKSKSHMFNSDNRRWFKIQRLEGTEDELALCYFASNKSSDVKGWIFLNDISEISEDKSCITVVSPARTMTVEAQTIGEHRLWLKALVQLCPKAKYDGETAAQYRNRDDEEKSSRERYNVDSKNDDNERDQYRRSSSRDNSIEKGYEGRDSHGNSRGRRDLQKSSSREEFISQNDDERRGRGKRQSHDDNSTGSNGSRGRAPRAPNTSDDHRKGRNLNYSDASTAGRMHSHINGDSDERLRRGRPPPSQPSHRSRDLEDDYHGHDTHRDSYELESYDITRASACLSREERLEISRENELRRQYDDGHSHEDKEYDENNASIIKRQKPAPPRNGPQPRWNSPSIEQNEETSDEEKQSRSEKNTEVLDEDDTSSEKPVKKRGKSIEDMIDGDHALTINLDDDSEDEEKVDFKAEKRRYANDVKAQSERDKVENSKSKPPLAPPKSNSSRPNNELSAKGGPGNLRTGAGLDMDSNFLEEDWDEGESPPKAKGKQMVQTGSQADSNWLEEDFDD